MPFALLFSSLVICCEAGLCHGYLMLSTSIVFCLWLFSLSSRMTPFQHCRQSSVFYCVLSVFYPLSFPPKLLAASHRDATTPSQLCFLCCIVLKMDFLGFSPILFRTSSFMIFVQLIFCILLWPTYCPQLSQSSKTRQEQIALVTWSTGSYHLGVIGK